MIWHSKSALLLGATATSGRRAVALCQAAASTDAQQTAIDPNYVKVSDETERNQLVRLTLCNYKQRNALGLDMIRNLQKSVDSIHLANNKCRALVISAGKSPVFSSGHNLNEFRTEKGLEHHRQVFKEFTKLCLSLKELPVPTIAEVYGLAAAAGFQLAASCDMIVASNQASFSTPGVRFGVFCSTPGVALSRNLSSKLSMKMLFTGLPMSASEAWSHGLVSELVDVGESNDDEVNVLEKYVQGLVREIAKNTSASVVSLGKKCFYEQVERASLCEAYNVASEAMLENLKYEDTQSGLKAFASKQKPVWSHKSTKISY